MSREKYTDMKKAEVVQILSDKTGFSETLRHRIEDLSGFETLPFVNPDYAQIPRTALSFQTADTTVSVFISRVEDEEAIVCTYLDKRPGQRSGVASWGVTSSGEKVNRHRSSIGLSITQGSEKATSVVISGGRTEVLGILYVDSGVISEFAAVVEEITHVIEHGVAQQGDREFGADSSAPVEF